MSPVGPASSSPTCLWPVRSGSPGRSLPRHASWRPQPRDAGALGVLLTPRLLALRPPRPAHTPEVLQLAALVPQRLAQALDPVVLDAVLSKLQRVEVCVAEESRSDVLAAGRGEVAACQPGRGTGREAGLRPVCGALQEPPGLGSAHQAVRPTGQQQAPAEQRLPSTGRPRRPGPGLYTWGVAGRDPVLSPTSGQSQSLDYPSSPLPTMNKTLCLS